MTRAFAAILLVLASAWLAPLTAQERAGGASEVDGLFERLLAAETQAEADQVVALIAGAWSSSESPTSDLLFRRALVSYESGSPDVALDLLDRLTDIDPEFAEAWHLFATLKLAEGNHEAALGAFERTVSLEPRHFIAHFGIGAIMETYGSKAAALAAYKRALAINPRFESAEQRVRALEREVHGQGI